MFGRTVASSRPGRESSSVRFYTWTTRANEMAGTTVSGDPLILLAKVSKSPSLDQSFTQSRPLKTLLFSNNNLSSSLRRSVTLSERRIVNSDSDEELDGFGSSENEATYPASTLVARPLHTVPSSSSGRRGFGLSEEDLLATSSQDEDEIKVESIGETKSYFDYISSRRLSNKTRDKPASSFAESKIDLSHRKDSDARSPFTSRLPSPISPDQRPSRTTEALKLSAPPPAPSDSSLEEDHDYLHRPSGSQSGIFFSQTTLQAYYKRREASPPLTKTRLLSKTDEDREEAFSQASQLPSPQLSSCSSMEVSDVVEVLDGVARQVIEGSEAQAGENETAGGGVKEEIVLVDTGAEDLASAHPSISEEDQTSHDQVQENPSPQLDGFDALMEKVSEELKVEEDQQASPHSEMEDGSEPEEEDGSVEAEQSEGEYSGIFEEQEDSEGSYGSPEEEEDEEEGYWVDGGKTTDEFREHEEIDEDGFDSQDPIPNGPTHAELNFTVEEGLFEAEIEYRDDEDHPREIEGRRHDGSEVDLDLDATTYEVDFYAADDPDLDSVDLDEEGEEEILKVAKKEIQVESDVEEVKVVEVEKEVVVRAISPELEPLEEPHLPSPFIEFFITAEEPKAVSRQFFSLFIFC